MIEDLIRFGSKNLCLLDSIRRLRGAIDQLLDRIDYPKIVRSRRTDSDPGTDLTFDRPRSCDLQKQMIKSFARAKQASRILEELMNRRWKRIRFSVYQIEKMVLSPKFDFDPTFYVVWDEKYLDRKTFAKTLSILIKGGITTIQFRIMSYNDKTYLSLLKRARKEIPKGITMIVNNRLDLALVSNADGIHLGNTDISIKDARRIGGPDLIIGATIRNPTQLKKTELYVDYLGVGSIYPSPTKPDACVIGIKYLKLITKRSQKPVVAIGGIKPPAVSNIFKAGAKGVAVSSYIFEGNLRKNLKALSRAIIKSNSESR